MLDKSLILKALEDPIQITLAVIVAGLLFRWLHSIEKGILGMSKAMPFRLFLALVVIVLGIISSVITAIIAAIVLVTVEAYFAWIVNLSIYSCDPCLLLHWKCPLNTDW